MKTYELIAPCHFGLEAVLKREIDDLREQQLMMLPFIDLPSNIRIE